MDRKNNHITFSHWYKKLERVYGEYRLGLKAILIGLFTIEDVKKLPGDFLTYDTIYESNGSYSAYPLKEGQHIVLVFFKKIDDKLEDKEQFFTTIRPYTSQKLEYYQGLVNKDFDVVLKTIAEDNSQLNLIK